MKYQRWGNSIKFYQKTHLLYQPNYLLLLFFRKNGKFANVCDKREYEQHPQKPRSTSERWRTARSQPGHWGRGKDPLRYRRIHFGCVHCERKSDSFIKSIYTNYLPLDKQSAALCHTKWKNHFDWQCGQKWSINSYEWIAIENIVDFLRRQISYLDFLTREFRQRWVLNFFGAGAKFDAGADENHEINFHRPNCNL